MFLSKGIKGLGEIMVGGGVIYGLLAAVIPMIRHFNQISVGQKVLPSEIAEATRSSLDHSMICASFIFLGICLIIIGWCRKS